MHLTISLHLLCTPTCTCTSTPTCTHTRARARARTHTHTHTHTHTQSNPHPIVYTGILQGSISLSYGALCTEVLLCVWVALSLRHCNNCDLMW